MLENRIKTLQNSLQKHDIDALLVTSSYNIAYLTGIHAFSIEEREARLLVTPKTAYLFTDARYTGMVSSITFLKYHEINASSPFLKLLQEIIKTEKLLKLGLEEESITYKEVLDIEELIDADPVPTVDIVETQREIKNPHEIESIKKACALSDKSYSHILQFLKPGVTELDVKAHLENYMRLEGGDISFPSIIAFGKNSAIPHHISGNTMLSDRDIVLLDFGAKINGYCSDMTRTIFLQKPEKKIQEIYDTTHQSQKLALEYLKKHSQHGFKSKKVHDHATKYIKDAGFPPIPHAVGHGVGLQVHELPTLSPYSEGPLLPGMIVTIEPGIYIPGTGGVRIEDTVLITADGHETLTNSSRELTVI